MIWNAVPAACRIVGDYVEYDIVEAQTSMFADGPILQLFSIEMCDRLFTWMGRGRF
jgi:hypothetical protein